MFEFNIYDDEEGPIQDSKLTESTALFNSMLDGLDQKSPRAIMKEIRSFLEAVGDHPDSSSED